MDVGPADRRLSPEDRIDRALHAVARKNEIEPAEMKQEIAAYVAWARADDSAASDYQQDFLGQWSMQADSYLPSRY